MTDVHSLLRKENNNEFAENCAFAGSPPNNKRIERWWRYLKEAYIDSHLPLLRDMRDSGGLDLSKAIHIECLRICFIPVNHYDLDMFETIQATENDFAMDSCNEFSEIALETMLHLNL